MPYIDRPSVEAVGKRNASCSAGKQVTIHHLGGTLNIPWTDGLTWLLLACVLKCCRYLTLFDIIKPWLLGPHRQKSSKQRVLPGLGIRKSSLQALPARIQIMPVFYGNFQVSTSMKSGSVCVFPIMIEVFLL